MPLSSSDELTGLFLGAVASPQSRPPLHPVHSNYNGPIQQRSVPESDTTFLLLPSILRTTETTRVDICDASGDAIGASTGRAFDWTPVGISTMKMPTCARCREADECETFAGIPLCEGCVGLIVTEWKIKRDDFVELAEG